MFYAKIQSTNQGEKKFLLNTRKNNSTGFTLIELLVVVSIIGFIVAASVLAFNNARMKSRDVRRVAHIKQIQTALGLYYNDANSYPSTVEAPLPAGQCLSSISGFAAACAGTTYMSIVPTAPLPADGTCTDAQNTYTYAMGAGGTTYTLSYCLGEARTGGIKAGPHTATPTGLITYNISIYEKSGTFTCNSGDTAIAYKTTAVTCGSSSCTRCTTGSHDWSPTGNYREVCSYSNKVFIFFCSSSYICQATPYVRCKSVKY